jgi:hypothetical protein
MIVKVLGENDAVVFYGVHISDLIPDHGAQADAAHAVRYEGRYWLDPDDAALWARTKLAALGGYVDSIFYVTEVR